ncbi:MAG: 4Fe-4S binding protein [Candidatus Lokiarchaeota archaeon]|nr:4Fe-4S binding protein [Candidatus Lokiarchaeota archaeon]
MPRMFERLRGLYTPVVEIRRRVFAELARLVVEGRATQENIEAIPYQVIKDDVPHYRCCVFKERAIVRERVRLACGLDLKEGGEHEPKIPAISNVLTGKKVISDPLVNVIKIGCERCPTDSVVVTDLCRNCMAHPCIIVCPVNAISIVEGRSHVDTGKCIKCLRCTQVCPYEAIVRRGRPCAQACGVDAIGSDAQGYAEIDHDKCVSCGLCTVSCPFGAIADKSEIMQVLHELHQKERVHAIIAPSFVSQFGNKVSPPAIFRGLQKAGFAGVMEVAYGADHDMIIEADKLAKIIEKSKQASMNAIPGNHEFLGTSCCPSWVMTARKFFPELASHISDSYTPMVVTAKKVKQDDPGAKVVFIGPCVAKKHESLLSPMNEWVDHVLTFEELAAIFVAMRIDLMEIQDGLPIADASRYGRGYAVAGGVCNAIATYTRSCYGFPEFEVNRADTLRDCRKMLASIKNGEIMPRLVEGMACPDGCIGGPGTLAPLKLAKVSVEKFSKDAGKKEPSCESR